MDVLTHKCPNCGGPLTFDPNDQKFHCDYCLNIYTEEEVSQYEQEQKEARGAQTQQTSAEENGADQFTFTAEEQLDQMDDAEKKAFAEAGGLSDSADDATPNGTMENEDNEATMELFLCPSCGAEIVTDATTAATFCYYCHNPVVLGKRLEGKYLPNKVIPFKISKKEAEKRFLEYVGKKKFVPKAFFNKKQIECLSGVYFPYWIYDAKLQGKLQGEGKKIRVWRTGDTEYTETKFYHVEREGEVNLKNLAENALQKANVQLVKGVLPYQFNEMKDFNMGYLSGFMAEKRDIEQKAVEGNMQATMKNSAEKLMRESVQGYNALSVNSFGVIPKKEDWSYALLPVWTVTYKGKDGKIYYYSMNGQTGKVFGELPVDYGKVTLTGIISAVVVLIIALIGGYFL